ncbi:MAG: FAD-binding oxidoreductase [Desmonostoc vinosum HA7617-LM4]|jgi:glycine/D-amino acid oxidase-like deaminating enzyme|nr:FAD-binding oxidoreductase [Desmonostoc vinosum HA7617-LM4]
MRTYEWIVIGGGITGAALAYELAKVGFSVLLLEQHVTPQNATRYSYGGLAYWSGTTPIIRQLCAEAIARHRILSQELDADTQFRELDLLLTIAANDDPETIAAAYAHVAIPPRLLSIKEACDLEPLLNPEAIAGALTVKHGHIHPEKTTQAYIQAFLRMGGEIEITQALQISDDGVQSNTTTYLSDNIAICAGGLSRQLLKSAGIPIKLYFTHAEVIETPPVDVKLRTLIMPANLQRFQLETNSTQNDQPWNEPGKELLPPILDPGAIQFQDHSLRLGQISRVLTDPHAKVNAKESETWLRKSITQILPSLGNLPGTWHHCLVAFSNNRLPLIGAIPQSPNIHLFSGFSNPLVMVSPLAKHFANFAATKQDEIITQISCSIYNLHN